MGKVKKGLCVIGITVPIIFILTYIHPRRVQSEYNGFMYRIGDNNYAENIKVIVDGYFSNGLLRGDKFKGNITIGNKELIKVDVEFDELNRGHLFSYEEGDYSFYGTIFEKNKLEEFTIGIYEENEAGGKGWSTKGGLMVSAPAMNRERAVSLSNLLMKDILINETQIH
ncbi:MAG: hypothetical protein ACK5JH_01160 [Anaerocolumna sp.]